jgi:hypothetical protein
MEVQDAILATLIYYDGLDYPLCAFELYRYLINPQRLRTHIESLEAISLEDIHAGLDKLLKRQAIFQELGFYCLKGRTGLATLRIEREKISAQKWRHCLRLAYWFQVVPWLRGMFVSGSLALGTVSPESDFDILVLVEPGRLYLARLFLSAVASLLGARRTRYETVAPDKFCFNHYLTTPTPAGRGPDRSVGADSQSSLHIKHESLYNAQTYAHLVPMLVPPTVAGKFFAENLWINKYVYNFTPHQHVIRRTVRPSEFLRSIAGTIEFMGRATLGTICERWARDYQQGRIARNPATHAPGGRVIYTSHELEFHPHSFERVILDHYNKTTRHLTISLNPEPDSGLIS